MGIKEEERKKEKEAEDETKKRDTMEEKKETQEAYAYLGGVDGGPEELPLAGHSQVDANAVGGAATSQRPPPLTQSFHQLPVGQHTHNSHCRNGTPGSRHTHISFSGKEECVKLNMKQNNNRHLYVFIHNYSYSQPSCIPHTQKHMLAHILTHTSFTPTVILKRHRIETLVYCLNHK